MCKSRQWACVTIAVNTILRYPTQMHSPTGSYICSFIYLRKYAMHDYVSNSYNVTNVWLSLPALPLPATSCHYQRCLFLPLTALPLPATAKSCYCQHCQLLSLPALPAPATTSTDTCTNNSYHYHSTATTISDTFCHYSQHYHLLRLPALPSPVTTSAATSCHYQH